MLTQDCAALVLGYYPISLREKDRCRFHQSRVGFAGGRLLRDGRSSARGRQQPGRACPINFQLSMRKIFALPKRASVLYAIALGWPEQERLEHF